MPFYADELENTERRYDTIDKNISESAETITFTFSIFFCTTAIQLDILIFCATSKL